MTERTDGDRTGPTGWTLHPDRVFPAEATTREFARTIYAETRELPLVSMHGHVDAGVLATDAPFGNPAEVFVVPDHYLVRMLIAQGVAPDALGLPRPRPAAGGRGHRGRPPGR